MRIDFDNLPDPEICWDWFGSVSRDGYCQIAIKRVAYTQHRYVYERLVGPIPEGLQLDHLDYYARYRDAIHQRRAQRAEGTP